MQIHEELFQSTSTLIAACRLLDESCERTAMSILESASMISGFDPATANPNNFRSIQNLAAIQSDAAVGSISGHRRFIEQVIEHTKVVWKAQTGTEWTD